MFKIKKIIKHALITLMLIGSMQSQSFALGNEGPRVSRFDHEHSSHCNTGGMGSFGIGMFSDNEDVEWQLDHPTCLGFMIGVGTTLAAAHYATGGACEANPAASPFISYSVGSKIPAANIVNAGLAAKLSALGVDCGTRISQSAAASAACSTPGGQGACPAAAVASASATSCCTSYATTMTILGSALAILGALFETAKITFENARVCGHDWLSWQQNNVDGFQDDDGGIWTQGSFEHSRSFKLREAFENHDSPNKCTRYSDSEDEVIMSPSGVRCWNDMRNPDFREYFYNGAEFIDYDGDCSPPSSWSEDDQKRILGYVIDQQAYYMKGPGQASNYACHRYISTGSRQMKADERKAFDCCVARSSNTLCIESKSWPTSDISYKFCELGGGNCSIDTVGFKISSSISQTNVICAQTNTLCPYDHLLGGGTEEPDHQEEIDRMVIDSKMANYCQYNKHCVKVPAAPYVRMNDYTSAFISGACKDWQGHSQNVNSNSNGILPLGVMKNFSAPLIECMAETLKNVLQNKSGDTICMDPDKSPRGPLKVCGNNLPEDYFIREGFKLPTPSIFNTIQDFMRITVKLVLTLSIVVMGYGILMGNKPVDRRKISVYILKFACVMYFAIGTGWNDLFIDNVFKISSSMSSMVLRMEDDTYLKRQLDGCQFPKFNGNSVEGRNITDYSSPLDDPYYKIKEYTDGFDYLRPWDILDCKFVKAIGFGPSLTVGNLVLTIFAGLLTGGLGIIFVMFTFIFAFFYIVMIIRALHVFLISIIAISLLIFVSPFTITAVMFEKTKNIFTQWLKQILGFIVQPVILFAYITLFIVIIDRTAFGIRPEMSQEYITDEEGVSVENPNFNGGIVFEGTGLDQEKNTICLSGGMAYNKSLYCIFGFTKFGKYHGLEPVGIILPFIFNFNSEKLDTIIKSALIMFIFAQFMDKISDVAAELTGSRAISSSTPSVGQVASKAYGIAKGVQKRGTRVAKRAVGAAGRAGAGAGRNVMASRQVGSGANQSGGSKSDNVRSKGKGDDNDSNNDPSSSDA